MTIIYRKGKKKLDLYTGIWINIIYKLGSHIISKRKLLKKATWLTTSSITLWCVLAIFIWLCPTYYIYYNIYILYHLCLCGGRKCISTKTLFVFMSKSRDVSNLVYLIYNTCCQEILLV